SEGTEPQKTKEVVADISLKESGYKLGSKLKDSATGEEFTITAFTQNNTFSHSPVIFVGWDAWKLVHQTNQAAEGEYNAVALD
ncbi:ABC transporter permease, partial [Staphylococcus aureus]